MFLLLLLVTFSVALTASFVVVLLFSGSIGRILERLVVPELAGAWRRYLTFALYVVGVSGGVRVWSLEQYVNPREPKATLPVLNADRWTLEVYRTVIGTLQSMAWMLLVVFVFLLIAYVLARGLELRANRSGGNRTPEVPPR